MERREALQQAIDEIGRQRREIQRLRSGAREPIAIVGMACRLPGAPDIDAYWDLLDRGGDAVTDVPADRWNAAAFYDADASAVGKMTTRQGAFVRGVDQFDPQFFGIAPREAQSMDPQQRLLLEVAWEALENANIAASDLYGSATGVFVGITCFDHAIRISQAAENFNAYAGTGSALNMAPGRLSYVLGLTGPSMAIDTACSSSLVSLHLACQSLRARETNTAIVGGVHLILSPHVMVSFSQARMLAADGRSKTFDASADGYSRGEGCGVVVLKRLADAVANGDTILGVIRGTAVNQDGPSGGLTVPNGAAQQQVIRRALDAAGVAPADVSYVETHGTGTPLGDPIEVEALAGVYGGGRSTDSPLLIGSVKTNIGHLEPAAGMAGLIKLLLAFRHGVVPRHLHFATPNPLIPWSDLAVRVAPDATPWPRGDRPRIAGLSAFGFSGTNGHVIVEEPPDAVTVQAASVPSPPASTARAAQQYLLPLTAKTETALKTLAARYVEMMARSPERDLASLAYTASIGRAHFPYRLAVLAATTAVARAALDAFIAGVSVPSVRSGKAGGADYRRDAKDVTARLADAYERGDLNAVATLYLEGIDIDWTRLYGADHPRRVTLPTYPFERQRYWIETPAERGAAPTDMPAPPGRFQLMWTAAGSGSREIRFGRDRRWAVVADREDAVLASRFPPLFGDALTPWQTASDIIFISGASTPESAIDSCVNLLALIHQVTAQGGALPRIWVITRGALPVAGAMTPQGVAQAPLAAFARVIGLERPELFGRLIDRDPAADGDDAEAVLAEILRDEVDDQVALRAGQRFVQRVERLSETAPAPAPLGAEATYLITGGLGRLGLLAAKELARRGASHLVLAGRHGVTTGEQRAAVAAIESTGAAVRIAAVDVCDRSALEALLRDIPAARPLAGVIHAAGLPGYRDISEISVGEMALVLGPKVLGAWHLHELTRGLALDFFVCFSSISSAWGSRGQAHYSAGNAFLDAMAYLRRSEGLPAVTINWGPWVEGGMTSPEAETLLRRVGIRPLPTADALGALGDLMNGPLPQAVVANIDLALFKGSYEARGHRPLLERLTVAGAAVGLTTSSTTAVNMLVRQLTGAPPAAREQLLVDAIGREVADVLELSAPGQADPDQGLFEMGMDSLMALELRTRLETLVSCALPATLVFDFPTIRAIARMILRTIVAVPDVVAPAAAAAGVATASAIDDMTEAEAEALLLEKLNAIR